MLSLLISFAIVELLALLLLPLLHYLGITLMILSFLRLMFFKVNCGSFFRKHYLHSKKVREKMLSQGIEYRLKLKEECTLVYRLTEDKYNR